MATNTNILEHITLLQNEISNLSNQNIELSHTLSNVMLYLENTRSHQVWLDRLDWLIMIASVILSVAAVLATLVVGFSLYKVFSAQQEKEKTKKEISQDAIQEIKKEVDILHSELANIYKENIKNIFQDYFQDQINNKEETLFSKGSQQEEVIPPTNPKEKIEFEDSDNGR
ncbi:MAG: hypothetical protein ACRCV0_06615 [Brevinema sp.]